MKQLSLLLREKNVGLIRQWLRSANAEKQLYALRGYRVLVSQGYDLTDEEKRIISIVGQKKGIVNTCSGCIYMHETFQDVVSAINSTPIEYLRPEKPDNSSAPIVKNYKTRVEKKASFSWVAIFGIIAVLGVVYLVRRTSIHNKT